MHTASFRVPIHAEHLKTNTNPCMTLSNVGSMLSIRHGCWGVTQKIRMIPLTQERVLNTFKYKVRAQRDCDSLRKLHKFQKV
jgi:hypothetical protein